MSQKREFLLTVSEHKLKYYDHINRNKNRNLQLTLHMEKLPGKLTYPEESSILKGWYEAVVKMFVNRTVPDSGELKEAM